MLRLSQYLNVFFITANKVRNDHLTFDIAIIKSPQIKNHMLLTFATSDARVARHTRAGITSHVIFTSRSVHAGVCCTFIYI